MKTAMIVLFSTAGVCFFPYIGGFFVGICVGLWEWFQEFFLNKGYKDGEQVLKTLSFIGGMCIIAGCIIAAIYSAKEEKAEKELLEKYKQMEAQQQELQP